jgi:hypothetical protein
MKRMGVCCQRAGRILHKVEARYLILDLARVTSVDTVAADLHRPVTVPAAGDFVAAPAAGRALP